MKVAKLISKGKIEIQNTSEPEVKYKDALVKVKAGGICGTDLHIFSTGNAFSHPLGHELSGIVVKNNSECEYLKEGDKVVVENALSCGICNFCKNGQPEYCSNIENLLMEGKLGFQEYISVPTISLHKFEKLNFEEATLVEPLTVALELISTADVKLGQNICIFGPGPIGLMACNIAKHMGVNKVYVTGISQDRNRLDLAEKIGADKIIEVDKEDLYTSLKNEIIDRVLITAPPYTIPDGVRLLRFGGILTYIGFAFGGKEKVELDLNYIHLNKLQIRAAHAIPNRFFPLALEYLEERIVEPKCFISREFNFISTQKAFEYALKKEGIKTVISFID